MSRSVHPTIYDVAARAGVSIATVSKTLNAPTSVALSTRKRVLDAVQELDYVPKEVAASRARRGTGRIGVFAPFSAHPSFGERLNGVLGTMSGPRHEVVVFDVRSAEESADVLESLPALRSLDGLIIMSVPFGKRVTAAMHRGRLPVVLVDLVRSDFPTVLVDDFRGGSLAATALLQAGKTRLAYFGHRQIIEDFDSPSRRRQAGFEHEIANSEVDGSLPDTEVLVGNDFAEVEAVAEDLLRSEQRPDGVFAHTDELAAAVWAAANRIGLHVPDDLAIVGFDDGVIAQSLGLTTIRQPLRETGQWAAQSMRDMIAHPGLVVPSLTLPVSLIRRRSA